ncbi:putative zinc-binding metallopeptidase [Aquiflexum sp.]|uniref:zinc-binding metallopeptidase family protein n=1 Tax=Aquiflexum sp. TaxID=1872584 RepID=UPI0035941F7B
MQIFKCDNCSQPVYFDNTHCLKCQNKLGFDPDQIKIVSMHLQQEGSLTESLTGKGYHYCSNYQYGVCNWLIPNVNPDKFCVACSLNRIIPDLSKPEYLSRWKVIEFAKHRLIYALLRWGFPIISKSVDYERGLAFNFKSDSSMPDGQTVITGHSNGLITMNISEADDVEREMTRNKMDEVYRTVLGHFRHEIGHYYWERLIDGTDNLTKFRELYGDERTSYQEALNQHYKYGAPADWNLHYISAYATMHPWESWAEAWAHYMHMVDTLETAYSYGLSIDSQIARNLSFKSAVIDKNAYFCKDFETIYQLWLPLIFTMNSLNRSMGAKDLYPFVINASVKEKLKFIHQVVQGVG